MQNQLLLTFDRLAALGRLRRRRLAKKSAELVGRLSQGQPTRSAVTRSTKKSIQPKESTPAPGDGQTEV